MSDVKLCDVCGKIIRYGEKYATVEFEPHNYNAYNMSKLTNLNDLCEEHYKKIYDALFGTEFKNER